MSDPLEAALHEVRDWKRRVAEQAKGLTQAQIIAQAREQADEFAREFDLKLLSPHENTPTGRPS